MAVRNAAPARTQLGDAATLHAQWKARGIDPGTIVMRNGTAVAQSTTRAVSPKATVEALPPLLDASSGGEAQFAVVGTLGEGGMGIVRLARQSSLHRDVALKSLKDDVDFDHAAASLLREARVTGALEHPHVVPVYALGRDAKARPMLAMKRIEGKSWAELLAEPADRSSDAYLGRHLDILRQVAMAVVFAHSKGVLHRDIKPDNVMIGSFGEVYLVDWGIACSLREDGVRGLPLARAIDAIEGTPSYMAPEMAVGAGSDIDERSDVFLLGATLHEILTGAPPHDGNTLTAVLTKAFLAEPHDYPPGVPRALAEICHKAMARFAGDRYPSAAAFAQALGDFLTHRASMRLSDEAEHRLGELEAACGYPDDEGAVDAAQSAFTEVRFAFQQALRSWDGNAAARAGLRRALTAMIGFELARGVPEAAETYLRELGEADAPPALAQAVKEALADKKQQKDRLTQLERDRDLSIGERERRLLTRVLSVSWAVGNFGIAAATLSGAITADVRLLFAGFVLVVALAIGLGRVFLPALGVTEANRQLMKSSALGFFELSALALGGWKFGIGMDAISVACAIAAAANWAVLAITIDRNWWLLAAANAAATVLALLYPLYAYEFFGAAGAVGGLLATRRWVADQRCA